MASPNRLSRLMAGATLAAAVLYTAGQILAFLDPSLWGQLGALEMHHTGIDLTATLPLAGRLEALAIDLVPTALGVWALIELARLFAAHGQGVPFGLATLRHLKRAALLALAYLGASLLCEGPISLALTAYRGPAHRVLALSFTAYDPAVLLLACALFAIGRLMAEAGRAADENARFV